MPLLRRKTEMISVLSKISRVFDQINDSKTYHCTHIVHHRIGRDSNLPFVGQYLFDVTQKDGSDDASTSPHEGDPTVVEGPPELFCRLAE